jgi:hypothetical protein
MGSVIAFPKAVPLAVFVVICGWLLSGCALFDRLPDPTPRPAVARVVLVTPVLNLSGSTDFDSVRVTDLIASEFATMPGCSVVPVNIVIAELALHGQATVQSPEQAIYLAQQFGADATVITAVTSYNPYFPPEIGITMQWYDADVLPMRGEAKDDGAVEETSIGVVARPLQVQRIYNAAHDAVRKEVRKYADDREGHKSPYKWEIYLQSQELFVRYASWSTIHSIVSLREKASWSSQEARR